MRMPLTKQPKGRVLIIDDDATIRTTYRRVLRNFGYDINTAADGQGAIEQLGTSSFDVVLCDIAMPGINGLELLRAVRDRDLDVPVILMTGEPNMESAVEAVEYGALQYLIKPIALPKLKEVMHRAVSLNQMARLKREALRLAGNVGKTLSDRASLETRIEKAIERLWVAFQPIVLWPNQSVFAYEALVRTSEPSLARPEDLIEAVERLGRISELSRSIRAAITRTTREAPGQPMLFVNLHAADFEDPDLFKPEAPLSAIASRVVLEITERAPLMDVKALHTKIGRLREMGFKVAIDDLGAGYAGLSAFSQLEPDFVKLDMSLIRGVDTSGSRRSVVRAMVQLCNDLGARVISEGVETAAERDTLSREGCELLQGFLFAKPERAYPCPKW
jgi:EAL domain-containing protein (putative c-di-GMP-specific phosphodiesterase class I)